MVDNYTQLETDAVPRNLVSNYGKSNNSRVQKIDEHDLDYVEKHLDFDEKVS